jgi:hypothetical protein
MNCNQAGLKIYEGTFDKSSLHVLEAAGYKANCAKTQS